MKNTIKELKEIGFKHITTRKNTLKDRSELLFIKKDLNLILFKDNRDY